MVHNSEFFALATTIKVDMSTELRSIIDWRRLKFQIKLGIVTHVLHLGVLEVEIQESEGQGNLELYIHKNLLIVNFRPAWAPGLPVWKQSN